LKTHKIYETRIIWWIIVTKAHLGDVSSLSGGRSHGLGAGISDLIRSLIQLNLPTACHSGCN